MTVSPSPASAATALNDVKQRLAAAQAEANRPPNSANLIAVSKTYEADAIVPVLEAGQRHFGENRVQEAKAKWPELRERYPDTTLHLIGPLQSNKAREAVELFDCIHTIDRPKIAKAIADEQTRLGKRLKLFIEVNTGEEPQKAGILPRESAEFLRYCQRELGLEIAGLMCIPPVDEEPAVHFAFLAKLARDLRLAELSMGMSSDFETAANLGATQIRIGSAIFGARS